MAYATLGDFLVSAALYRIEGFPSIKLRPDTSGTSYYVDAPVLVDRWCESCGPTKWKFMGGGGAYAGQIDERSLERLRYDCKNCERASFSVWIMWWRDSGSPKFMKAGQHPKLEITIPKEFGEALGNKRPLYMKGMTLRHNAYGIGALTYFRRLIEDTTDEMLDLLERSMEETQSDPGAIEKLKKAKKSIRFDEKVRLPRKSFRRICARAASILSETFTRCSASACTT